MKTHHTKAEHGPGLPPSTSLFNTQHVTQASQISRTRTTSSQNMQFSLSTTIVTLVAGASIASAGVALRAEKCTYKTANYLSQCKIGDTLFCTGNTLICPSGKTDTFDTKATQANEDVCAGKSENDSCTQTVACC